MSLRHPTGQRPEQPIQKAARLIAADAVIRVPDARVYDVLDELDVYRVITDRQSIICPCPERTALCVHVLAVASVRVAEPEFAIDNQPVIV